MNLGALGSFVQKGRNAIVREMPKICAGAAVAGVFGTAALAVWKTPEALRRIEEMQAKTKREKAKAAWKSYIPAMASAVLTCTAIITGHSIQMQRYGELAIAYGFSQTAAYLYSMRVRKEIGAEREQEIRSGIGVSMLQEPMPPANPRMIRLSDSSDPKDKIVACYDYLGSRYFHDSLNHIRASIERFNEEYVKQEGFGSLNELYSCFNKPDELPPIQIADDIGWKYVDGQGAVPMITHDGDKDGNPCIVLDFYNPPQYNFDR